MLGFVLPLAAACPHDGGPPPDAAPARPRAPSSAPDASTTAAPTPPVAPARGPVPPAVPAPAAGAPDLAAVQALLVRHQALRFDAAAQDRGCPAEQSLGEYVAMLAHNGGQGDAPGDVHQLAGTCLDRFAEADRMALDPPADPAYWLCRIDAYTSDPAGESPWHYELRLRVKRADRTVDLGTLACPGTP